MRVRGAWGLAPVTLSLRPTQHQYLVTNPRRVMSPAPSFGRFGRPREELGPLLCGPHTHFCYVLTSKLEIFPAGIFHRSGFPLPVACNWVPLINVIRKSQIRLKKIS